MFGVSTCQIPEHTYVLAMLSLSLSLSVNLGLYPLTSLTTCYCGGALLIIPAVSFIPVCDFEPFLKSPVLIARLFREITLN